MKLHPASLRLLGIALLVTLLPWAAVPTQAAEPPAKDNDLAQLRAACDQAMRRYSRGILAGFEDLFQTWWFNPAEAEVASQKLTQTLHAELPNVERTIGLPRITEFEYLGSRRLGTNLVTFVYLQKHQWAAMPLAFCFSRHGPQWRMINMTVGDIAAPFSQAFLRAERPAALPAAPAGQADFLHPTTLPELRQACDAFLESVIKDQASPALLTLFQNHFVHPARAELEAQRNASEYAQAKAHNLKAVGALVPGQPELVGLIRLGTHQITLHYSLRCTRGIQNWKFFCYQPDRAWRLQSVSNADPSEEEYNLLTIPYAPQRAGTLAEVQIFDLAAQTIARIAQDSPSALDELLAAKGILPAGDPLVKSFADGYQAALGMFKRQYGPALDGQILSLGANAYGNQLLGLPFVILRERDYQPICLKFIRQDQQWRFISAQFNAAAFNDMRPHRQFTILSPPRPSAHQSSLIAVPDLAALERAGHRFVTRVSTGQAKGAVEELLKSHPGTSERTELEVLAFEVGYLTHLGTAGNEAA